MNVVRDIVHEAEVQRQHVRLRLPVKIMVDELEVKTHDWSVGGFAIDFKQDPQLTARPYELKMMFDLNGFQMRLPLRAEPRHTTEIREGTWRVGFEFVDVTEAQNSFLRYVVGAHLSGELVDAGDILAVVTRDNTAKARKTVPLVADLPLKDRVSRTAGRLASLAAVLVLAAGVAWFLGRAAYERAYQVEGIAAEVTSDMVIAQAPAAGTVSFLDAEAGGEIKAGEPLLGIARSDGETMFVDAPCDCVVIEVFEAERNFVGTGDPVIAVVPKDAPLFVEAFLPPEEAEKIRLNTVADLRVLGSSAELAGRVVDSRYDRATRMIALRIETDGALATTDIGRPVVVSLDAAPSFFGSTAIAAPTE